MSADILYYKIYYIFNVICYLFTQLFRSPVWAVSKGVGFLFPPSPLLNELLRLHNQLLWRFSIDTVKYSLLYCKCGVSFEKVVDLLERWCIFWKGGWSFKKVVYLLKRWLIFCNGGGSFAKVVDLLQWWWIFWKGGGSF